MSNMKPPNLKNYGVYNEKYNLLVNGDDLTYLLMVVTRRNLTLPVNSHCDIILWLTVLTMTTQK